MTHDDDAADAPKDAQAFDRDAAIRQLRQAEAELRELVRRKRKAAQARARAEQASDPRDFAVNSLLAMEGELVAMFDSGESPAEVLAYLQQIMPGVPSADLRHALKILRQRNKRADLNVSATRQAQAGPGARGDAPAQSKPAPKVVEPGQVQPVARRSAAPTSTQPPSGAAAAGVAGLELPEWADGSDRMAEESEADYILRKHIEGPPEARRKFIGEHNS